MVWPCSYFKRKSEERKNTLKEEILAELLGKTKSALEEQGKSVKKDGERLVKEFSKEIKDERKGLEARMQSVLAEFGNVKSQSEKVSGESTVIKKDSERIKVFAEEAKTKADGAVKGVQIMEAAAARANELCDTIDAKLKGYTGKAVYAAVEKCTAAVKSEMDAAVKTAREEYRVNLDDSVSLLETGNMKRMTEFLAKLTEKSKEEIEAVKKKCLAEIDAFKKEYAAVQSDYQKILPRIDAAAQKFKELEARIIALSDFAQKNTYELWFASSFSQMQRQQLRELYSEQYRGDVELYKKSLEDKKNQLKGKKDITPQEIGTEFAIVVFNDLNNRLKIYKKEDLPKLWEAIDLLDGIKRKYIAVNTSRPDSGRQNRH